MSLEKRAERSLLLGEELNWEGWEQLFVKIFRGRMEVENVRNLLLLLRRRGERATELLGCVRAVRRLECPSRVEFSSVIDVCGTGGDGLQSFNISTVSAFVIAGAGGYVAKHGNRAVSSRVGSSDLMEALGIRLEIPFRQMLTALGKCHMAYFHAPLYHRSFAAVRKIREDLGVRTIFNLLGPLVNPVDLKFQMIGTSNQEWLEPLAIVLRRLGRRRAAVFRSNDGLDELSTYETNDILYVDSGGISQSRLSPRKLGFYKAGRSDYAGGDLETNREIALAIIQGRAVGPRQDVVLLNSGVALWLTGLCGSVSEGVERSRWAIRTGRAAQVLNSLRYFTNRRN